MNSRRSNLLVIIALAAGMTVSWGQDARAFHGGASSSPDCNSCHTGVPAQSVSFMSNNAAVTALSVARGATVPLTLRVASAAQRKAGFNVSSSNGAVVLGVVADPGTRTIAPGQVTHTSSRVTNASGIADFPFKITAGSGAACGTVSTLKGEGLASLGATAGKASTVTIAVTVTCP